jgi:hypothetical protein
MPFKYHSGEEIKPGDRVHFHREIARDAEAPEIAGAPEVVSRTSVLHQPDSPLAIVAVDLSRIQFAAAPGTYSRSGPTEC